MVDYNIIVTGSKWVKGNVLSTERAIKNLIDGAFKTLVLTIYIITNEELLNNITDALKRKVNVEIFLYESDELNRNVLNKIKDLTKDYPNLTLHISTEEFIHAKVLVADTSNVIIGSANLTNKALKSNYEMGILLKDENIAFDVERIIKRL